MKRHAALSVLCFLLLGCAAIETRTPPAPSAEARKLADIFERYFEEYLELFPLFATQIGDHRYDDQLRINIGAEHRARQQKLYRETLEQLSAVNIKELTAKERLYHETLMRALRRREEATKFPGYLLPVRQLGSLPIEFPLLGSGSGSHPFRTVEDYDNFLKRIDGFELWVETAIANMREGIQRGIVQPKVVVERTLPQLEAMVVKDVKDSLFYQPIKRLPAQFSSTERDRLTAVYAEAIETKIIPTYRRLATFMREEYLSQSRDTIAWSDLPGGHDWYDYLVRSQTTTELTPDEIFQLGMDEVGRIKQEMERLRERSGFSGTLEEFSRQLSKTAPRPFSSRDSLIKGYVAIWQTVDPHLAQLFGRVPTAPFEVRTIEEFRERSAPSQYWSASPDGSRPGIFYVNASGIEGNPRRASESLFLHEAIPGHHFQISLQQEQKDLPRFQRFGGYTAFIEGWALYAESLGQQLDLYKEPDQYFSRLNSELFRAVRLVVDVGLHRKGWSREQAMKFMMDTTMSGESGVALEIDRYIANPAQALAYKIGQLKISSIRAKAEKTLGAKFDIRTFHDELLKDGALPLSILEDKMDQWIEQTSR
ncbi:MAG TPA: DUF885 domain-containing protein [Candidatus Binatia bacterium]|nr:DUF885 domain-containing protein [Candidatus Binatia bacterium]